MTLIMSVFNGHAGNTKKAIESILAQNYHNFEFIIVDDAATDVIRKLILKYADEDKRIIVIRNEKNLGLTKSLNIAIESAQGRYVARMDDDDIAERDRLKEQLDFLVLNNYDLIGCDCKFIDDKGDFLGEKVVRFPANLKNKLMKGNFFTHSTLFGKKEVFEELYDKNFQRAQDYEFLFRIISKGYKVGHLNKSLLQYRISNRNISAKNAKQQEWCAIRARWKAITELNYSKIYAVHFIRAFISFLIPYKIKRLLMNFILK